MASPVAASITVVGSMSPGLNFTAFPLVLAILDRFTLEPEIRRRLLIANSKLD
jgi:hypothetical protein